MTVVDVIFILIDICSLVFCSIYIVFLLPRDKRMIRRNKWVNFFRAAAWMIYAVLTVLIPNVFLNDLITVLGLSVFYILTGYLLYHRDRTGVLYQLGFMIAMYATQVMAIMAVAKSGSVLLLEGRTTAYSIVLLKATLLLMTAFIFRQLIKKRYAAIRQDFKIRGMILVPVISMILIFWFMVGSEVFFIRYGYGWLIVYCVLILVINLYCLYFWYDVSKTQELKHKLALTRQQNELTHQFYADLESNYAESRKIIHDIRNHLQMLEQSQKLAGSQRYVDDVHQMLNSLGMVYYTDNRMLNIILNDKLKPLRPEQFSCHLGGVSLDFLSEMDTTTIFANLLDNALEARRDNEGFWLEIHGEKIQDFCVVKMSNTTKETYVAGHSSKEGHEGIGLENVCNAVGKYHGEMQTNQKEQVFSVTLIFPG